MKLKSSWRDRLVSRETMARLADYERLVQRWSPVINLVSVRDLDALWPRHIEDCLQILPLLPSPGPYLDIGSGAGLPGLVLAIASGKPFYLIEADHRKASFLREAARQCGANVTVLAERIETVQVPPMQVITARAVAPVARLLGLAFPHLHPQGRCLFLKGSSADRELTAAFAQWHMTLKKWPSLTDKDSVILQISGLRARSVQVDPVTGST